MAATLSESPTSERASWGAFELETGSWARESAARVDGVGSQHKCEEVVVALLQLAARLEVAADEMRARLCSTPGFSVSVAFAGLRHTIAAECGCELPLPGRVPLAAMQRWMALASCSGRSPTSIELSRVVLRKDEPPWRKADVCYPDFAALVLPRGRKYKPLRRRVLSEAPAGANVHGRLPANVAREFQRLLSEQVESLRLLQPLARAVEERLVQVGDVFSLLAGPAVAKVVTAASTHELLTEQFGALSAEQSTSLFQRFDATCSGSAYLEDVAALVQPLPSDSAADQQPPEFSLVRESSFHNNPNLANAVQNMLITICRLGDLELAVEHARAWFCMALRGQRANKGTICPEAMQQVYAYLDRGGKGFVSATDIWQLLERSGRQISFASVQELVRDVASLRDPLGVVTSRLGFREVCVLFLPWLSDMARAVRASLCDADVRSALYITARTSTCPGCGAHAQRSAVAVQTIVSTCSTCGTVFRCVLDASDREVRWDHDWCSSVSQVMLDAEIEKRVLELLEVAANASAEARQLRLNLARTPEFVSDPHTTLAYCWGLQGFSSVDGDDKSGGPSLLQLTTLLREHGLLQTDFDKAGSLLWLRLTFEQLDDSPPFAKSYFRLLLPPRS